jgi:hypothetical protein
MGNSKLREHLYQVYLFGILLRKLYKINSASKYLRYWLEKVGEYLQNRHMTFVDEEPVEVFIF